MCDPGDKYGTLFDRHAKDQAICPEPETIVILPAIQLPGVNQRVLFQGLQGIQNLLAEARGKLPERTPSAGQHFNFPPHFTMLPSEFFENFLERDRSFTLDQALADRDVGLVLPGAAHRP